MKKVFALILCLILTLSVLVACSDKEEEPANTDPAVTTTAAPETTKAEETTKKPRPQSTRSQTTTEPETYPVLDWTPEY